MEYYHVISMGIVCIPPYLLFLTILGSSCNHMVFCTIGKYMQSIGFVANKFW